MLSSLIYGPSKLKYLWNSQLPPGLVCDSKSLGVRNPSRCKGSYPTAQIDAVDFGPCELFYGTNLEALTEIAGTIPI